MPGRFITRHSIKEMGELYLFQAPLLLLGIYYLFTKNRKSLYIFGLWIILYPLGSTFTTDKSAQATRSIIGVIPWQIISAAGLVYLLLFLKSHILKIGFFIITAIVVFFSFSSYLEKFYSQYPLYSSDYWGWQYGPKEIMGYFLSQREDYDDLYLSGEFNAPYIFLKFYDPQNLCENKCQIGSIETNYDPTQKQLFALSLDTWEKLPLKENFVIKKPVYYPNGKTAFLIGEYLPN